MATKMLNVMKDGAFLEIDPSTLTSHQAAGWKLVTESEAADAKKANKDAASAEEVAAERAAQAKLDSERAALDEARKASPELAKETAKVAVAEFKAKEEKSAKK